MAQPPAFPAEVVRDQTLRCGVVLVDPPAAAVAMKHDVALATRQTPKVRNANLDNEEAAWLQMDRRVGEARDLLLLRGEVSDGVENEVDKPERTLDTRASHVADRHTQVATPRLQAQLLDHRLRELDSANVHAAGRQRERNPSGADRKLESPAIACQLREHLDGRLDGGWVEHLRYGFVVGPRDVRPEMILTHKAIVALTPRLLLNEEAMSLVSSDRDHMQSGKTSFAQWGARPEGCRNMVGAST